jgi:hypothetical protein
MEGSMINTRTLGFGLAVAIGLLVAKPAPADEACQKTLADINAATATLNQLQALHATILAYQASVASGGGGTAVAATVKCDACGMTMPMQPTGNQTRAVKIGGHTYYCCAGCDMSKQVDKE